MPLNRIFSASHKILNLLTKNLKVNTTLLNGFTCLDVGLISFAILGSLYLFHFAKRKHCQNQNDEVLIDVSTFLIIYTKTLILITRLRFRRLFRAYKSLSELFKFCRFALDALSQLSF